MLKASLYLTLLKMATIYFISYRERDIVKEIQSQGFEFEEVIGIKLDI